MTTRKYARTQKAAEDLLSCAGATGVHAHFTMVCVRAYAVSRQMEYALKVINLLAATRGQVKECSPIHSATIYSYIE